MVALPRLPAMQETQQLVFLLPRGVEPYDPPTTVLVQRSEPQGVSTVLSSTDFFQSKRNRKVILEQVDSFQLRDKYLFATTTRVRGRGWGRDQGWGGARAGGGAGAGQQRYLFATTTRVRGLGQGWGRGQGRGRGSRSTQEPTV